VEFRIDGSCRLLLAAILSDDSPQEGGTSEPMVERSLLQSLQEAL
jgi:hypothetical protein